MADTIIVVSCPQCGQSFRGSAELINRTVLCQCGHEFPWNAASLRNVIQPRIRNDKAGEGCTRFGLGLSIFGVMTLLMYNQAVGPLILMIGLILLAYGITAPWREQQHHEQWLRTGEAQQYLEYEKLLQAARETFRRIEEAERRAAQEKQRRAVAEKAKDRKYLLYMSPRDFEQHVGDLFAALGYAVTLTPASGDEGVDAYLQKNGRQAIVQCKHLARHAVSRPDLQRFFGVLQDKRADEGFFFTTGRFSAEAMEFAKGKPIHLIDLQKLVDMASGVFTEEFIRSGPTGHIRPPRRSS